MTYLHSTDKDIYQNFQILHPDGSKMCFCDEKKIRWYLKRGLAKSIDEKTIQLLFEPRGRGDLHLSKAYENNKQNACVVCGTDKNLTKHHIVPYQYRKHFPEELKSHNHFDVLPVCIEHHEEYEREADLFNKKLVKEAGIVTHKQKIPSNVAAEKMRGIIASLRENWDKIPPKRRNELLQKLGDYFGVVDIDRASLSDLTIDLERESPSISIPSIIVNTQKDIKVFIVRWRNHFVDNMKPQHLPKGWREEMTHFFGEK